MPAPRTLAFQRNAFQDDALPSDGFQHSAFQENVEAFQTSVAIGAFQESAFQDSAFQAADVAFEQLAFQGDGFQFGVRPSTTISVPRRALVSRPRRDRWRRTRGHVRPRVFRAPLADQPPVQQVIVKKAMVSRIIRARRRNRTSLIVRARLADQPPKRRVVLEQVTQLRSARARGRRRKPLVLRAPSIATATPLVRNRVLVRMQLPERPVRARLLRHKPRIVRPAVWTATPTPLIQSRLSLHADTRTRKIARLRRRKPILLHAPPTTQRPRQTIFHRQRRPARAAARRRPLIFSTRVAPLLVYVRPKILVQPQSKRARFLTRRPGAQIARAPSVTTSTPLTRPGVQVIRADRARPRRFARLRRKPVILGRVRGQAASFVPYLRPTILVKRRRTPVARLRHDQPIIRRSFVAPFRPRAPIVEQDKQRARRRRPRRRQIVRPSSAPQFRFTLTQSRRARRPLPRRRHPLILRAPLATVIVGFIPPTAYGDVLVSDREQFTVLVLDEGRFG